MRWRALNELSALKRFQNANATFELSRDKKRICEILSANQNQIVYACRKIYLFCISYLSGKPDTECFKQKKQLVQAWTKRIWHPVGNYIRKIFFRAIFARNIVVDRM